MREVVRTESTVFMPLHLTLACLATALAWGAYGVAVDDVWAMAANGAGVALALAQLALYLCYPPSAAELAAEACTPLLRQTGSNHRMLRAVLSLPSRSASRSCSK